MARFVARSSKVSRHRLENLADRTFQVVRKPGLAQRACEGIGIDKPGHLVDECFPIDEAWKPGNRVPEQPLVIVDVVVPDLALHERWIELCTLLLKPRDIPDISPTASSA